MEEYKDQYDIVMKVLGDNKGTILSDRHSDLIAKDIIKAFVEAGADDDATESAIAENTEGVDPVEGGGQPEGGD